MLKEKVKQLLEAAFLERPDLFLISLSIGGANQIQVVIDGDNGVLVEDCVFISRAIEHNLDREEEDFSLDVMSSGATSPLVNKRQYKKNIGRILNVKTATEEVEGIIVEANESNIVLEFKVKEPKPIGKGKVTVSKFVDIAYSDIVEAKVMIKF